MDEEVILNSIGVVGPDDKLIVHIDDPQAPYEQLKGIADKLTSMFGDRSVILVGNSIHINIVRGNDGTI